MAVGVNVVTSKVRRSKGSTEHVAVNMAVDEVNVIRKGASANKSTSRHFQSKFSKRRSKGSQNMWQ